MAILRRATAVVLLALSLTLALTGPAAADVPSPNSVADLDLFVQEQLERTGVPGAAYAIVGRDGIEHTAVFGTDGDGQEVSAKTPFLWGSVSKPVTATLVALLERDGLLSLDDPVRKHLPRFAGDPAITLRQLIDHTSGLPEGLELTDRYDGDRSAGHLLEEIAQLEPVGAPGELHSYSSLNYIVLASVVEAVTGESFVSALDQRLRIPARMHSPAADLPPGHRYVFGSPRAFEARIDPATQAAGYLTGTIEDLAAFAHVHLPGGLVLTDQERETLHTQQVANGPDSGYALGWRTSTVPGTDEAMVWHGGAAPGYQAAVLLLPERDQAVVLLQNAYSPFRDDMLMGTSMGLASLLAGAEPETRPGDPLYVVILGVFSTLAFVLLFAGGRLGFRIARPVGPRGPRVLVPIGVGLLLAMIGVGLLLFPGLMGVSRGQVYLWAPDIAVLLHLDLALVAVIGLLYVLKVFRTRTKAVAVQRRPIPTVPLP